MNLSVNMVTLIILLHIRLGIIYIYKYRNIELWAVYNPVHISMIPNLSVQSTCYKMRIFEHIEVSKCFQYVDGCIQSEIETY